MVFVVLVVALMGIVAASHYAYLHSKTTTRATNTTTRTPAYVENYDPSAIIPISRIKAFNMHFPRLLKGLICFLKLFLSYSLSLFLPTENYPKYHQHIPKHTTNIAPNVPPKGL